MQAAARELGVSVRWCGRLLDGVSANVREGQQVRQYVDGLRTNTVAVTATGSCSIWQFTGSKDWMKPMWHSSVRSALPGIMPW